MRATRQSSSAAGSAPSLINSRMSGPRLRHVLSCHFNWLAYQCEPNTSPSTRATARVAPDELSPCPGIRIG